MPAKLSLSIATDVIDLPAERSQLRRWVNAAFIVHQQHLAELSGRNQTQYQARFQPDLQLHLQFLENRQQRRINDSFRGKDYATNVLTFILETGNSRQATRADVLICPKVVQKEARQQKKPFMAHLAHLVIHGTLHALGHDHEKARQAEKMEALEVEILRRFRINDPYQVS